MSWVAARKFSGRKMPIRRKTFGLPWPSRPRISGVK
jgi:hypothetical protein